MMLFKRQKIGVYISLVLMCHLNLTVVISQQFQLKNNSFSEIVILELRYLLKVEQLTFCERML